MAPSECAIMRCGGRTSGIGQFSQLHLCERHCQIEERKCQEIKELRNNRQKLAELERRCDDEKQRLSESFEKVRAAVDRWQKSVCDEMQRRHDRIVSSMRDFDCIDSFESQLQELSKSEDSSASLSSYEILVSFDRTVDNLRFDYDLRKVDGGYKSSIDSIQQEATFGDISSSVKELDFIIEQHMTEAVNMTQLNNKQTMDVKPEAKACTHRENIKNLGGKPTVIASCCNTRGYGADESQRVVKLEQVAENSSPLPQPGVFVAFDGKRDFLTVLSVNDTKLRYKCEITAGGKSTITGLHCDSERQQLYIVQRDRITITDLSGTDISVLTPEQLGVSFGDLSAITGNCHKYFVIDGTDKRLLCINKDTQKVDTIITNSAINISGGWYRGLANTDGIILVTDRETKKILKLSSITQDLLAAYPTNDAFSFKYPWGIAIDSRGIIYACDWGNNVVQVFKNNGSHVATLGTGSVDKMKYCIGLLIMPTASGEQLFVCDCDNSRIIVYSLL